MTWIISIISIGLVAAGVEPGIFIWVGLGFLIAVPFEVNS